MYIYFLKNALVLVNAVGLVGSSHGLHCIIFIQLYYQISIFVYIPPPLSECPVPPGRGGQYLYYRTYTVQYTYNAVYVLLTMYEALDIIIVFFNHSCNKHLLSMR